MQYGLSSDIPSRTNSVLGPANIALLLVLFARGVCSLAVFACNVPLLTVRYFCDILVFGFVLAGCFGGGSEKDSDTSA